MELRSNKILSAAASLAVYLALPSSLQAIALTNGPAAVSKISNEFKTGTSTWFTKLPTDVQSYFISEGTAGAAIAANAFAEIKKKVDERDNQGSSFISLLRNTQHNAVTCSMFSNRSYPS